MSEIGDWPTPAPPKTPMVKGNIAFPAETVARIEQIGPLGKMLREMAIHYFGGAGVTAERSERVLVHKYRLRETVCQLMCGHSDHGHMDKPFSDLTDNVLTRFVGTHAPVTCLIDIITDISNMTSEGEYRERVLRQRVG